MADSSWLGEGALGDLFLGGDEAAGDVFLSASSAGQSSATSRLVATVALSGASNAQSNVVATFPSEIDETSQLGLGSLGDFTLGADFIEEDVTVVTLAGSSTGTSTVSSSLTLTVALAAASAGQSTAAAFLQKTVPLAAASNAVSTATANLTEAVYLTAASNAVSTASANVSPVRGLIGASNAVSTAGAVLLLNRLLVGASAGVSSTQSTLSVTGDQLLRGAAHTTSTVRGALSGGQVTSTVIVYTQPAANASTTTAPSAYGTTTVSVVDASGFSVGQYVVVGDHTYVISNIVGDTLHLSSPLLQDIGAGAVVSGVQALYADAGGYAVAHSTLLQLEALARSEPVLVDMQDRHPAYVRSQPLTREISLDVYFLATTTSQRRADYEALLSSLESLSGLVTLRWTNTAGQTREYVVAVLTASADAWFQRGSAVLVAPDAVSKVAA